MGVVGEVEVMVAGMVAWEGRGLEGWVRDLVGVVEKVEGWVEVGARAGLEEDVGAAMERGEDEEAKETEVGVGTEEEGDLAGRGLAGVEEEKGVGALEEEGPGCGVGSDIVVVSCWKHCVCVGFQFNFKWSKGMSKRISCLVM